MVVTGWMDESKLRIHPTKSNFNSNVSVPRVSGQELPSLNVKNFLLQKMYLQVSYNAIVQLYFDDCCPLWDNSGKVVKGKQQKY